MANPLLTTRCDPQNPLAPAGRQGSGCHGVSWKAWLWLPLSFGIAALLLGQDDHWDLRNYHLYNPYAWLHGRLQTDLAPAGLQSYFNPLLDAFQMWLYARLPAPLAGFLLGWLQGLGGLLLIAIGRRILPSDSPPRRAVFLGIAACLAACFLSELGSAMGDNLTAVLVLCGFLLVLDAQDAHPACRLLLGGALVGMATGLKLTNAVYALGLCGAVLFCVSDGRRIAQTALVGVGALVGVLVTAGYWFWHLWQVFGNPLFPQFGTWFPNPLAAAGGVADARFLPHGLAEALAWPLVFSASPSRIGEHALPQLAWPFLYLLLIALAATAAWRRWRGGSHAKLDRGTRLLAAFVVLSFISWMAVFSIHRYLVPAEMLAPLLCWQLVHCLLPPRLAGGVARWIVAAIALVGLGSYWRDWGHAGWSYRAFQVEQPVLPAGSAAHGTVLLAGADAMAWRIPFLPPELAFIGIGTSFPAGPSYSSRVREILHRRGGDAWVMLPAADYPHGNYVAALDLWIRRLGLDTHEASCMWLGQLSTRVHLRAKLVAKGAEPRCHFELRDQDRIDLAKADRAMQQQASTLLAPYGLDLVVSGCRRYDSWIGRARLPYLWCPARVTR